MKKFEVKVIHKKVYYVETEAINSKQAKDFAREFVIEYEGDIDYSEERVETDSAIEVKGDDD